MSAPLAYFLTFRTYGSWLHGDPRGSVDSTHNNYGAPLLPASTARMASRSALMKDVSTCLSVSMRQIVLATFREVCSHRGWRLLAANVRESHVHVLVYANCAPEKVMADLKAWCTRRLRQANLIGRATTLWAHHRSTRYITTASSLEKAHIYTLCERGVNPPGTFWPHADAACLLGHQMPAR